MGLSAKSAEIHLEISTEPGYFLQDDPNTNSKEFNFKSCNFGLIDRPYPSDLVFDPDRKKTQWQRFEAEVVRLNRLDEFVTQYKVLFLGRHGQGYHNLAETLYSKEAWDCYWSRKTGNNDISWIDSELTPLGVSQALDVQNFWAQMIELEKIPTPQSYYTSPLLRCQQTAFHTFSGLAVPSERPFNPVIKELLRETIGVHTCDKRSTKSTIQARYPDWTVEDGFTETDELWSPSLRESRGALDQRSKVILDDILGNDENQFLSISSHSGLIGSILNVLGHREFGLDTGGVIPVLVKIDRVPGLPAPVKKEPWFTPPTCDSPPDISQ